MNNNIDIEKLRSYINDLEEQITPLTKSKGKPDVKEVIQEEQEQPITSPPSQPTKKKITRTVTEKKKEQLIKAREVRKTNTETRNKMKKLESAKLLLQNEIVKPSKQQLVSETESSSESEIVIVKKPKQKKKPRKKIIIQDDESTEESEDEEPEPVVKNKQFGKSHRNKKSVIKIHDHPSHAQPNYNNFFC